MKSLILKDLYNIGHNAKSMVFMLLVYAFIFLPSSGITAYLVVVNIMCSMMIITTFAFDEHSKWTRYAMIMPVSKKELVKSKFVVLIIFCGIGMIFGFVTGIVGQLIMTKFDFGTLHAIEIVASVGASLLMSIVLGCITIMFIFKFGAEKARLLMFFAYLVPVLAMVGIYNLLVYLGVEFTTTVWKIVICIIPILAIVFCYAMYRLSYAIFSKKEL